MRDRFRGRITFPINDLQGRLIGFGARVLPSDARASEQAKYLNTAETPIYRKHEVLYNMHRARQAVAKTGDVFVVEGYTDVIGLAQAGIHQRRRHVRDGAGGAALRAAVAVRAARDLVVRLRRGGRAGGRASVRVPGEVPDHGGRADHARGARPGRFRCQARLRRRSGGRRVGPPARRIHGAAHGRTSRPVHDRGPVGGGLGRAADPRAPGRSRPPLGVRGACSPTSPGVSHAVGRRSRSSATWAASPRRWPRR